MEIIRPYDAEDNETNKCMLEVLERYTKKNNLIIDKAEIYLYGVKVFTEDNQIFIMNVAEIQRATIRNIRDYLYMKTEINGKQKRIPKSEW